MRFRQRGAAPAAAFQVVTPASVASGTPLDVTVIAVDPYGNTDMNYTSTVHFTTSDSDPGVMLPPDYTFQATDAGVATFPGGVTLITPGDQLLTVTDVVSGITGSAVVTVETGGGAPGANRFRLGATAFWLPWTTTPATSEPAHDRVTMDWLLSDGANPLLPDPLAEVLAPTLCGTSPPAMGGDATTA